jgi:hypothetical protein
MLQSLFAHYILGLFVGPQSEQLRPREPVGGEKQRREVVHSRSTSYTFFTRETFSPFADSNPNEDRVVEALQIIDKSIKQIAQDQDRAEPPNP